MTVEVDTPACFAAASVFSADSNACKVCASFEPCKAASYETLQAIRGIINVEDLLKRHAAARKVAQVAMKEADDLRDAEQPPGNMERPLPVKPVERKTKQVTVTFEASPSEQSALMKIKNEKAKEVAYRMLKANEVEAIREGLEKGVNVYADKGHSFIRVALNLLLNGGFTKRTLREAYQSELGWTEGTASSHVGQCCAILAGFKLAVEKSGIFVVVPGSDK